VPGERTAQLLFVAESTAAGDRINSVVGLFEGAPSCIDPDALYCDLLFLLRLSVEPMRARLARTATARSG
jgi:hypothetical protein